MTDPHYKASVRNDCARWNFTYRDQPLTAVEQQIDSMMSEDKPSELLMAIVRVAIKRAVREQYYSDKSMVAWYELVQAVEAVACDMQDLPFGDEGDDESEAA
jgi:flagellar biosynthesis component FlhA